ncbi:MAG: alanine:cation symporter family protein [Haliea sp.]|nr:alanine:cation symporter family protein [Haliea sp.]MDP4788931.1 alanine:cation symporter family protein [Haliea sp.]MDP4916846.1 alanine:cation symporter family protein [Haliea sp.]MDP5065320.1 alanine:cation symporter family protein [Haliea sp.]
MSGQTSAFNPQAVGGGLIGVSRGVFSNEADVGAEVMALATGQYVG